FSSWFKSRPRRRNASVRGRIVYYNDTFTEFMHPEVGQAAVRLLEALGYEVIIVNQKSCCGRPAISKGQLDLAYKWAADNVSALLPYVHEGLKIVGTEPSCLLTLRDEYPDLLKSDEAIKVANSAFMVDELIEQMVLNEQGFADIFRDDLNLKLQVHGHCHQKAIVGTKPTIAVLNAVPGYAAELIDSPCCGMAGTFGFESEHYEASKAMGSFKLFPAIEAEDKTDWGVAVSGISCRQQIDHFTTKKTKHVVEYLAEALK
ncbi:MAG: FAD-binding oxidoreductase, partial [Gammaproteobacteria bacterium]|nr:FAD-binding oxidoreductase [Gammaproteobacteria bacterium]